MNAPADNEPRCDCGHLFEICNSPNCPNGDEYKIIASEARQAASVSQPEVQSEDATYEQSAILTALMNRAFAAERTLENIRDNAATMSNGGAWAAGLAVIRLAASERSSTSESLDLADHDEISRKVLGLPWAVQSAIVTIAAHCTVIKDKSPAGDVSDLAGCISQDLLELANALSGGVAQTKLLPCPICGGEAIHAIDTLKRVVIMPDDAQEVSDCGKVRELLGPFYQTVDVMVSAHNNEPNRMCVWASDVKAVQDVMLFLESLRDLASPVPSAAREPGWIDQNHQIDRYGVALMMIREGCADPAGLARRILSEFEAPPVSSASRGTEA